MTTTRIAILGATGYGGGELLRLLLRHPAVTVAHATSRSKAGTPISAVHRNLEGVTDLQFSAPDEATLAADCDLVIGALPHGASAETLAPLVARGLRVIDLSGDFRLRDMDAYRTWYKRTHPHPEVVPQAVYGCPELNRDAIRTARLVASPGCFATTINLSLLPLARAGLLTGRPQVVAMTGSSGSGADPQAGTHHPTRAQTLRPYKVLSHQHVPECVQTAADAGSTVDGIDFTPVSAPLVRGILAVTTAQTTRPVSQDELDALLDRSWQHEPFIKLVRGREPECATIAGTNYVETRARCTPDGRVHVVTALDNLVKGGAGQAVQSLNIMLGLDERTGLDWPGTWP